MRSILVLTLLVGISSNAAAQIESFLVPLLPAQNVPGARGSLWSTDLVIENSSDHNIFLQQDPCFTCGRPPIGVVVNVPPHATITNPTVDPINGAGTWLYTSQVDAEDIRFHLRVRDMSRQEQTFGTEIPVVSGAALHTTIRLIDVPTDPRFRVTLRIYCPAIAQATVTVLPPNGEVPLRTLHVPLNRGVAVLDPVSGLTEPSVRLVIDNGGGPFILWAFASVTNNDTQDVTTITESR
jgi:hypothetical protein